MDPGRKKPSKKSSENNQSTPTKDKTSATASTPSPNMAAPVNRRMPSNPSNPLSVERQPLPDNIEAAVATFMKRIPANSAVDSLPLEFRAIVEATKNDIDKNTSKHPSHGTALRPEFPCIERTRVVMLSPDTKAPTGEFLHANRVKVDKGGRDYIAAQAPKTAQFELFWRMIIQESCPAIVCLTPFFEDGVPSCDPFWPMENGQRKSYGKFTITNKKVVQQNFFAIYTLEVQGGSKPFSTCVAHYTEWPLKGVAGSGRVLLRINKWIKSVEAGPVCVLSSAGAGRAGSFIAIAIILSKLFHGHDVKVSEVILDIRRQRAHAVHNELQYLFIYSTVLDYIRAKVNKYDEQVKQFFNSIKYM